MLLNDDEIRESMESPLNLLNRLKSTLNRAIAPVIPSIPEQIPPKASDIIDNLDDRLKDTSTRSKAVRILNAAMDELSSRLPEVQKPERLASIATEMAKVISHQDNKSAGERLTSQIIVYAPQVQNIENYDIVEVAE